MRLNEYGRIVREQWKSTERIRPCIKMDTYIVMPNHLHGIVIMNDIRRRDTARRVPTAEQFGKPVTGSLPTVVGSFKSAVTKHVNILHNTPGAPFWQHRYYEHIVRNENDLNNIREYIITNPARWAFDKENPGSKKLN